MQFCYWLLEIAQNTFWVYFGAETEKSGKTKGLNKAICHQLAG